MIKSDRELFDLKRLTKSIRDTLKNWKSRGGEPSIPDMASAIQGWESDAEKLKMYTNLNSVSFQKAMTKLNEAWAERTVRVKAIKAVEECLASLEGIQSEISAPETTKRQHKSTMKSLFGDSIGRYSYDPDVFPELYKIKRHINGFLATQRNDRIDFENVKHVKAMIDSVVTRSEIDTPMYQYAMKASRLLQGAINSRERGYAVKANLSEASIAIDQIGIASERYYSPTGYKSQLSAISASDVALMLDKLEDMVYEKPFNTPIELATKAIKSLNRIVQNLNQYYDPKAKRLAEEARDNFINAHASAKSSVKTLQTNDWRNQSVITQFESAMSKISELKKHMENVI